MTTLAQVKPIHAPSYEMFVKLRKVEHVPMVILTNARYRADQKLIKAVKEWNNKPLDLARFALTDAIAAHNKATGGKP